MGKVIDVFSLEMIGSQNINEGPQIFSNDVSEVVRRSTPVVANKKHLAAKDHEQLENLRQVAQRPQQPSTTLQSEMKMVQMFLVLSSQLPP